MKMLAHRIQVSTNQPVNFLDAKAHCRIDFDSDDPSLQMMINAAAREIEDFAQVALLTQTIRVIIFRPRLGAYGVGLPVGPVLNDVTPTVTIDGTAFTGFDFDAGDRPFVRWLAPYHDLIPERMVIEYQAGFGDDYSAIPADLYQAILDQTAMLYEQRAATDLKTASMSPHMGRIGAKYRGVKM